MKMKLVIVFMVALLTSNVSSAETQIQSAEILTAIDMQAAFKQDSKPMELASLSGQEMKETEGAFLPFAYYSVMYGPSIYGWMIGSGMATTFPIWYSRIFR